MKIIINLKKLRQSKGLTQQDLAKSTGLRQATISDIENNKIIPNLETLIKLAYILNISLDEMILYEKIHDEYSNELAKMINKKK